MEHNDDNTPNRFIPNYELSSEEINRLTSELLAERANGISEDHRFVTIEVEEGCGKYSNLGRHVERAVFEESFGNDASQMIKEYGPYELSSIFFIAIDRDAKLPTGALRAIHNSSAGLKTLNDMQHDPFNVNFDDAMQYHNITNLDEAWDIGTVAVLPEYRASRSMPSVQLYRTMYLAALKGGIDHLVSVVDDKLLKTLTERLSIPFVPISGSKPVPYLGSDKSSAVYAYVPEFYDKMNAHLDTIKSRIGKAILDKLLNGRDDSTIILG